MLTTPAHLDPAIAARPVTRIAAVLDDPNFGNSDSADRARAARQRRARRQRADAAKSRVERGFRAFLNGVVPVFVVAGVLLLLSQARPDLVNEQLMSFVFGEWWPAKLAAAGVVIGVWTTG